MYCNVVDDVDGARVAVLAIILAKMMTVTVVDRHFHRLAAT